LADFVNQDGKPFIGTRDVEGPVIRLLLCLVCNTVEELPDYEGPSNYDYLLEISLEKHKFPSGEEHKGKLFKVPVKIWSNPEQKAAVIEQFKNGGSRGLDELAEGNNFYETKMTFASEAMSCWQRHNKPKENCDDYQSSSKRLLPDTAKERGELGLPKPEHLEGPKIYTCNFCPYHGEVVQRRRQFLGMYQ
jgi:hypothetical protein